MTACVTCEREQATRGVLCDACIPRTEHTAIFAAQVCSSPMAVGPELKSAWLVDGLGRAHHVSVWPQSPAPITIGRDAEATITIAHLSVSRRHATLTFSDSAGAWYVEDMGSRNRTLLNAVPLVRRSPLELGDTITVGSFAFRFVPLRDGDVDAMIQRARASAERDMTTVPRVERWLAFAPTDGGGGFVTVGGELGDRKLELRIALSELDFSLLQLLAARYRDEVNFVLEARGYVRSSDILSQALPFDSAHPTSNNLRGVVKRIRDKFRKHALGDIIESTQNLGYRLGYNFEDIDV